MSVRFGVSPIAWANDDMPELGADISVESILSDAHRIGFSGIELGGRFPRDPRTLGAMLAAERLDLIGGWWSTQLLTRSVEAEIEAAQAHIALIKALGAPVFIAAECSNAIHGDRTHPLSHRPVLKPGDWAAFGAKLNALAGYTEGLGLKFAYHFHLGTAVEDQADVDRFIAATGAHVGFVVDTGHAALGGVDAVGLIGRHPERVAHVHAKDVRRAVADRVRTERQSFLDGVLAGMFTAPGDGDVDFDAVMSALADIDYRGWIVVEAEQDPKLADPRVYGALGLATLRAAARAAELIP